MPIERSGVQRRSAAEPLLEKGTVAAIVRVIDGGIHQLHRLLERIERILKLNRLARVRSPVIEAARESLVIG